MTAVISRRIKSIGVLLALLPSPFQLAAQVPKDSLGVIRGRVVGPLRDGLEGAQVVSPDGIASATTAADGSFVLRGLPRSVFAFTVRRIGYNAQALQADLRTNRMWVGTIVLAPGSYQLPDITVIGKGMKPIEYSNTTKYDDVFRRMRIGLGTVISRKDIERRGATRTAELLQSVPGARVTIQPDGMPTKVAFARCDVLPPKVSVWIDGIQVIPEGNVLITMVSSDPSLDPAEQARRRTGSYQAALAQMRGSVGEMLSRISPNQIEMIEVYRGVAEIPGEFLNDSCAAIVIWTR